MNNEYNVKLTEFTLSYDGLFYIKVKKHDAPAGAISEKLKKPFIADMYPSLLIQILKNEGYLHDMLAKNERTFEFDFTKTPLWITCYEDDEGVGFSTSEWTESWQDRGIYHIAIRSEKEN